MTPALRVIIWYAPLTKEWRWHVKARNGKLVATVGEGYKRKNHCIAMACKLFPHLTIEVKS